MASMENASVSRVNPTDVIEEEETSVSSDESKNSDKKSSKDKDKKSDDSKEKDKSDNKKDKKSTGDDKKDDQKEKDEEKGDDEEKGKSDDINEDKDEDGDEKKKDGGKKAAMAANAASNAAGAAAPVMTAAGILAGIQALISGIFALIQALLAAIWAFISSICSAIVSALTAAVTAVAAALAISTVTAALGIFGLIACVVIVAGAAVASAVTSDDVAKTDQAVMQEEPCEVSGTDNSYTDNGTVIDADQEARAYTVYSVFDTYLTKAGASDQQARNMVAGMLGNWSVESGIDCTAIEGIYDEPNQIGPKKQDAFKDLNSYTVNSLFTMYANSGKSINRDGYKGSVNTDKYYCGLGIGQFTGPAAETLLAIADASGGKKWYDTEVQMAYILAENGYRNGHNWFDDWKSSVGSATAEECASYFLTYWEGIEDDGSLSLRQDNAGDWLLTIKKWEDAGGPDKALGESVIDMAGATSVEATNDAHNESVGKCQKEDGTVVFNGVIGSNICKEGGTTTDCVAFYNGAGDSCCRSDVYTINLKDYIGKQLANVIGDDGNVKPEFISGGRNAIYKDLNTYRGQCVAWSATRIKSYVLDKYKRSIEIGRFGNGGDPHLDGELLGCKTKLSGPQPNSVFSYTIPGNEFGHTGYVEYVDKNGVIITSECNMDNNLNFFMYTITPETYANWSFFSVEDVYNCNKDKTFWERAVTG